MFCYDIFHFTTPFNYELLHKTILRFLFFIFSWKRLPQAFLKVMAFYKSIFRIPKMYFPWVIWKFVLRNQRKSLYTNSGIITTRFFKKNCSSIFNIKALAFVSFQDLIFHLKLLSVQFQIIFWLPSGEMK